MTVIPALHAEQGLHGDANGLFDSERHFRRQAKLLVHQIGKGRSPHPKTRNRRSMSEAPCRVHALVKHPDDLHGIAAVAADDQVLTLVATVKAGAEIVAGLPQRAVDRQSFEARYQDVDIRFRLGLAPRRVGLAAAALRGHDIDLADEQPKKKWVSGTPPPH